MNTGRAALIIWLAVASLITVSCVPAASTPTAASNNTVAPAPTVMPNTGKIILTAFSYYPPKSTPKLVVAVKSVEAQLWTSIAQTQWVTLVDAPPAFDLAVAGTQHELAKAQLPVGDYAETRVILEKLLVSVDGQDTEIPLPNCTYYLRTPFGIVSGEETVVTISFDVQRFEPTRQGSIVQFRPYSTPFSAVLLTTRGPAIYVYRTPAPTQTLLPYRLQ